MTKFKVSNYRSLRDVEIEIPGFTILTGKNNSGKTSILYALLTLREFYKNSNQSLEQILVVNHSLNLGGFEQIVYGKDESLDIAFELLNTDNGAIHYKLQLSPRGGSSNVKSEGNSPFEFITNLGLPYTGLSVQTKETELNDKKKVIAEWNGIWGSIKDSETINDNDKNDFGRKINFHLNFLNQVLNVPKVTFNTPLNTEYIYESNGNNEVNILVKELLNDEEYCKKVNNYLEFIINKEIVLERLFGNSLNESVGFSIGTSISAIDKITNFSNLLVNEGAGIQQLVTILAMIFKENSETILIDEPELNLHPSAIKKLVTALVDINEKFGKKFIISTHSEHFVFQLLTEIEMRKLESNKVAMYLASKEGIETILEKQEINNKGQVAGGLKNFYDEESVNFGEIFA